jgi:AcrR family transcriptional regulator
MSKRRYDAAQTKKQILEKVKILFSEKGYAAASIEDIVNATGCSKGNLYYHFKNKEDLFLYLAEQTFEEWWEQWGKISVKYQSVAEKLYAYADYCADNFQRPLNHAGEEFLSRVGRESETGQKFIVIINHYIKSYEELISEGIATGEFKHADVAEMTIIFMSLHNGLNHCFNVMKLDKEGMRRLLHNATTLFLHGICSEKHT